MGADSTDTVNYKGIEFTPREFLQLFRSSREPPIAKIKKNIDAVELVLGHLDQLISTSENPAFVCRLSQFREYELRFKEMQQNFLNAFEATPREGR